MVVKARALPLALLAALPVAQALPQPGPLLLPPTPAVPLDAPGAVPAPPLPLLPVCVPLLPVGVPPLPILACEALGEAHVLPLLLRVGAAAKCGAADVPAPRWRCRARGAGLRALTMCALPGVALRESLPGLQAVALAQMRCTLSRGDAPSLAEA